MSRAPFRLTRPLSARFLGASPLNAALPAQCAAIASLASALATKSSPASLPRPVKIVSGTRHSSFLNRIKRFWKKAEVKETDVGLLITLDNRSVKTPGGKPLLIPKNRRLLAHMIAGEWESVQKMRTYAIPLTSLSARAIEDLTDAEIRAKVINDLLKYFQTDTVCFREPYPINLVELQKKYWDPLIAWVKEEFGCDVKVTEGIEAMTQEAATVEALKKAAEAFDPFELAAFERIVLNTKSYIISMAVMKRFLNIEEATSAARVELDHQIARWGEVEDTHDVDREEIKRQIGSAVLAAMKEQ